MRLSITLTSENINFFCSNRPPASRNNQLTDSCISWLDLCDTLSSSSIILGDVSVHFCIPSNPLVLKIISLLNRYSFYQAVTVPTHKLGHALDIVMFRPSGDIVCSTTVTQLLSSEHYCFVCDPSAIKPVNYANLQQTKNLRGIDFNKPIKPYMPVNFAHIMSFS